MYTSPHAKVAWKHQRIKHEWTKLLFGVELEVGFNRRDDGDKAVAISDGDKTIKRIPWLYWTEDSSVAADYNAEFLFHPGTQRWWMRHKNQITKLLEYIRSCGGISNTGIDCGMHIHASNVLSDEHLYRLLMWIYTNYEILASLSGRSSDSLYNWAGNISKVYSIEEWQRATKWTKYNVIIYHRETIELRLFAGTLEPSEFWSNMECFMAIIDYTEGHTSLKYSDFQEWLFRSRRRRKYPYFNHTLVSMNP